MDTNFWLLLASLLLLLVLIAIVVYSFIQTRLAFKLTNKNVRESVRRHFLDLSPATSSLVELAVEVWRLEKRLSKAAVSLSDDQNKALENSIAKLRRYLDKSDVTFTDYTDQKYNEGMNLDVLSIEKGSTLTESIIKETHEPAVLHKGQLIKKAKVVILEK